MGYDCEYYFLRSKLIRLTFNVASVCRVQPTSFTSIACVRVCSYLLFPGGDHLISCMRVLVIFAEKFIIMALSVKCVRFTHSLHIRSSVLFSIYCSYFNAFFFFRELYVGKAKPMPMCSHTQRNKYY